MDCTGRSDVSLTKRRRSVERLVVKAWPSWVVLEVILTGHRKGSLTKGVRGFCSRRNDERQNPACESKFWARFEPFRGVSGQASKQRLAGASLVCRVRLGVTPRVLARSFGLKRGFGCFADDRERQRLGVSTGLGSSSSWTRGVSLPAAFRSCAGGVVDTLRRSWQQLTPLPSRRAKSARIDGSELRNSHWDDDATLAVATAGRGGR